MWSFHCLADRILKEVTVDLPISTGDSQTVKASAAPFLESFFSRQLKHFSGCIWHVTGLLTKVELTSTVLELSIMLDCHGL